MDASDSTSSETALVSTPTASPVPQRGRSDKGEEQETQRDMVSKEFHALPLDLAKQCEALGQAQQNDWD